MKAFLTSSPQFAKNILSCNHESMIMNLIEKNIYHENFIVFEIIQKLCHCLLIILCQFDKRLNNFEL